MTLIRFKTRSLIRRFGTGVVDINDSLAKRYLDRGQAISVREKTVIVEEESDGSVEEVDVVDEVSSESQEEVVDEVSSESQEEVEEKVEVKIKKNKDKKKDK